MRSKLRVVRWPAVAVDIAERPAQPVRILGHRDDVDMVGHQAIAPDLDMRPPCGVGEQIEIELVIAILEKGLLAAIAALGDVVRDAGEDEAREAGHLPALPGTKGRSN